MSLLFEKYLLEVTSSSAAEEQDLIQKLWSDYGKISRYRLIGSVCNSVVIKHIILEMKAKHPRGWVSGHDRKVRSYQVETNWYKDWSWRCTECCRVPKYIGSYKEGNEQWIVMEDLNIDFPLRKSHVTIDEIKVCLKWLANFHASFLNQKSDGLWTVGTYWHLETRPDEFEKIDNEELKDKAQLIDAALNNCKFQTIVHGDAKLANFCFSSDSKKVAGVDFQYVGGGCGMKDVAYFLGSCLSGEELAFLETELLDCYFQELKKVIEPQVAFQDLENEWRKMYLFACADFTRFLLGWMPTHQKINDYQLKILEKVLADL